MGAAQWRKAMNSAAAASAARARPALAPTASSAPGRLPGLAAPALPSAAAGGWSALRRFLASRYAVLLLALVAFPFVASPFVTFQVGAQSLVLGMIALSMSFLAGYGGMISLAQMTVAGVA